MRIEDLKSDYAGVHRKIAAIWIHRKQPERALEKLKLALQSSPHNAELLEQIGNVEKQLGDRCTASQYWRFAQLASNDSGTRKRLTNLIGGRWE
jgi:tetratricopeptide (TPR) repeat protein